MIRWLIILLVVANLALFLWLSGRPGQAVPSRFLPQQEVIAKSMMLITELPESPLFDCVRVGPLTKEVNIAEVKALFQSMNVDARLLVEPARDVQAYRVFLGPFATETAVTEARERARAKNLDEFRKRYPDGSLIVSLGLFSQRDSAQRFTNTADAILGGVSVKNEMTRLPATTWFEVGLQAFPDMENSLGSIEWVEAKTAVLKGQCVKQP